MDLKRTVIYMIANGRGKGRGALEGRGGTRETPTWHTVALSTSEEPIHEACPYEGARGRVLSVGGSSPPFRPGMASFIQQAERLVFANHGHAGEVYVRHVNGWTAADVGRWRRRYSEVRADLSGIGSSNLAGRVGGYVAAIQIAGEIAGPLLGLPFKPDVVSAWLMLHLDEQNAKRDTVALALRALADHYIANTNRFAGDGRYDPSARVSLHGSSKRGHFVGFLREAAESVFGKRRWNTAAVLDKLAEAGALNATEKDRHTKKVSVGGIQHRLLCVKWRAIFPEDPAF